MGHESVWNKGGALAGELDRAFETCARLAMEHYENFTVGSLLFPKRLRRHLWSVYAYCRTTDDLGDEAPGDRLRLLDAWEEELHACFAGRPRHPVMKALHETIEVFGLSKEPFLRLIEANRIDQTKRTYHSFAELLHYCTLSANPVGRIVLRLAGCSDPKAAELSDAVCTGLQLANFWQDVARDLAAGRIYIPLEDMERFDYSPADLERRVCDSRFKSLMRFEVVRTREFLDRGEALIPMMLGRFRIDVALFGMGGRAVLDAIERRGFDVLTNRPSVSRAAKAKLFLKAAWMYGPWRRT